MQRADLGVRRRRRFDAVRGLVDSAACARALAALNAQRYADWDDYWDNEYPALVDRLDVAAQNLQRSEDFVQRLVFGIDPSVATGRHGKVLPEVATPTLAAVLIYTQISAAEKVRLAAPPRPSTPPEEEELLAALQAYYERQGLTSVAARTRAVVDNGKIKTLKGLKIGIEHGHVFVLDGVLNAQLSRLLPPSVKTIIKVDKIRRKVGKINDNIEVMMTSRSCRTDLQTRNLRVQLRDVPDPRPDEALPRRLAAV